MYLTKFLLTLILVLIISSFSLFQTNFNQESSLQIGNQNVYKDYIQWKHKHSKNTNGVQDQLRFEIFQENKAFIEDHNNSNESLKLGLTQFADMTNAEYREFIQSQNAKIQILANNDSKIQQEFRGDKSINWVSKGAVTSVKEEGKCGACWAFAAVGALEGLKVVQGGSLENLSEEQIIDCDSTSFGCSGGFIESAFEYTAQNGIESAISYPYEHNNNGSQKRELECKYNKKLVVFQNSGYENVPTQSPDDMYKALQVQPLVATIDANSIQFQLYSSGILDDQNCGKTLNFTLNIVGYSEMGNFWTLKNIWGTNWGMGGFVNIKATYGSGICGINEQVSYPI